MGRLAAQVNLVPCAPAPTSFFMALCDGGPPTMERLGAPDQGADPRAQLLGQLVGDHLTDAFRQIAMEERVFDVELVDWPSARCSEV